LFVLAKAVALTVTVKVVLLKGAVEAVDTVVVSVETLETVVLVGDIVEIVAMTRTVEAVVVVVDTVIGSSVCVTNKKESLPTDDVPTRSLSFNSSMSSTSVSPVSVSPLPGVNNLPCVGCRINSVLLMTEIVLAELETAEDSKN
jgi:hypothetical protein